MIQMLSAFDLPDGADLAAFAERYGRFVSEMREEGLLVSSSGVGVRVADTPMDTDAGNPRRHFTLMRFRDRAQLDAAYARLAGDMASHHGVHSLVENGIFTCWEVNDGD